MSIPIFQKRINGRERKIIFNMEKSKKIFNRVPKNSDYWWDVIAGGILTSMFLVSIGSLILMKLNLTIYIYPFSIVIVLIVMYYQWKDDNFTIIQTGFSKSNNLKIATSCLDELDWHYFKSDDNILLRQNKYILKFLNPIIIPESERILINFKYHSTYKTGRFPFFFGISTVLEFKFKRMLKKQILEAKKLDFIK
jgi:hypothetical protein